MNKTELAARIQDAAAKLKEATSAKQHAVLKVAAARQHLTDAENACLLVGVEGKNEAERKARLGELVSEQSAALRDAERAKIDADAHYDLAKIEWDEARQLVTIFTSPE